MGPRQFAGLSRTRASYAHTIGARHGRGGVAMRTVLLALACLLALGGCSSPSAQKMSIPTEEPTSTKTMTNGPASITVPTDWEELHESDEDGLMASIQDLIFYPPYDASCSLSGYDSDESVEEFLGHYDDLVYELERDEMTIVDEGSSVDGDDASWWVVYLDPGDDGAERQMWERQVMSGDEHAMFLGGISTSCTEGQLAEFAWVADNITVE